VGSGIKLHTNYIALVLRFHAGIAGKAKKNYTFLMKFFHAAFLPLCALLLFSVSCATVKIHEDLPVSGNLAGRGIKTADQLVSFFLAANPEADSAQVRRLAEYYVDEAAIEGINSDVAFVQMCLETGYLRFGGLVTPDMHNYCGLGAIDAAHPGERFPTEQLGVRAHIQHLHAYGTTVALLQPLVDNRYRYVNPRGKAPDIYHLAGTWAQDTAYGEKLEKLLTLLSRY
jgi:hypothetical protein